MSSDSHKFGEEWTTEAQRAMADGEGVFGAFADEYDALRPDYPHAMWSIIFGALNVPAEETGDRTVRALDVGAGTGRGALHLAQHPLVKHITVTEPDKGMLDQCKRSFAKLTNDRADTGKRRIAEAAFERVGAENLDSCLPPGSVDLAVCLQAWHWVDNARGLEQVSRVLRPGGIFAVAWNDRDLSVPWVAELERLIETYNQHYDRNERQCDRYGRPLRENPHLRLVSQQDIPNSLHLTSPQRLVDLTHTFSYVRNALTREHLATFSHEAHKLAQAAARKQEQQQQQQREGNTGYGNDRSAGEGDDQLPLRLPLKTRLYLLQRRSD